MTRRPNPTPPRVASRRAKLSNTRAAVVWGLRAVITVVLGLQVLLLLSPGADAAQLPRHPLGNFTTNTYDGLVVWPEGVRVEHVEDLAEIPAAQVEQQMDKQGETAWAQDRCRAAGEAAQLTVDGRAASLTLERATVLRRPGQAGLPTLRVECVLQADGRGVTDIEFRAGLGSVGWHEITAQGDRMTLTASDVPGRSLSTRLTAYPGDLLSSPLDQRTAHLRVRSGGPALTPADPALPGILPRGSDILTQKFTGLVSSHAFTPAFAVLAVLIAAALGLLHALAPGHGKTLMAAYAASRTQHARRDVLALGLTVTATHTAGVLILGLVVASSSLAPAAVYPWLTLASGLLLVGAGATMVRRALRTRRHSHSGTHEHVHGHHGHVHHGHANHEHEPGGGLAVLTKDKPVVTEPRRSAGTGGAALMGFAGGLVPSPSAVLVLLGAVALGRAWFGVVLVLAYGLGLAAALVGLGLLVSGPVRRWSGRIGERLHEGTHRGSGGLAEALHRLMHGWGVLPAVTASVVVVVGFVIAARGLDGVL